MSNHHVHEAVAGHWLCFEHIPGTENPANGLTKPLPWFSLKIFVEQLLLWKGNTVDAPLGTSDLEGSDASPGLTVPDEQPSHEQDLANVIGPIIPAILCGNQHTALHDMMPTNNEFLHSVQTVIMFDSLRFGWIHVCAFTNLTVCFDRLGIDHPDCIPVQDRQFVTQ